MHVLVENNPQEGTFYDHPTSDNFFFGKSSMDNKATQIHYTYLLTVI
jgi:hypothetical protein